MSKIEIDEETLKALIQQAAKNQKQGDWHSVAREFGVNPEEFKKTTRQAAAVSTAISGIIGYGIAGVLLVFGLPALIRAADSAYKAIRAGATIDPVGLLFWIVAIGFVVAFAAAFIWGFHRSRAMLKEEDEEEMG